MQYNTGALSDFAGEHSQDTEELVLRGGETVRVRPIRAEDAPRLLAAFERLSQESIFLRFLEYRKNLSLEQARDLAKVDYNKRMAFVAVVEEDHEELVIAVARYSVITSDRPDEAEVAIVVVDQYQNQGLGSYLIDRITDYAREHGIRTFIATISLQNARIMHFIRRSGLPTQRKLDLGMWEIRLDLTKKDKST